MAYCRWLSAKTGMEIRIPSEQQWQRAAIGDTGWSYPWGDEIDKTWCNYSESGIGQPTPVTQYDVGASPYGAYDMIGNVWEWTLTEWEIGKNNGIRTNVRRVVRGGAFDDLVFISRAAARYGFIPINGSYDQGFRVCAFTKGD